MKLANHFAIAALALAAAVGSPNAAANHTKDHLVGASAATAAATLADGEVRKIDKEQGKLTLRHGPIANLDMPGMTMVFKVADRKMLDALKEGDKVKFAADKINGAITVTAIETAK